MKLSNLINAAVSSMNKVSSSREDDKARTQLFETLEPRMMRSVSPVSLAHGAAIIHPVTIPVITAPVTQPRQPVIPIINPILTNQPTLFLDAIQKKYNQLGGSSGFLGLPVGGEILNGHEQQYQNGNIYWSAATGAHEVHGVVLQKYLQGNLLKIGYPTSDLITSAGAGVYNTFSNGAIFSGNNAPNSAFYITNPMFKAWMARGGALHDAAGYPIADTADIDGGEMTQFQGGDYFYSPSTGAHEVDGVVLQKYMQSDRNVIGFPTSDPITGPSNTGYFNNFSKGAIYCSNNDPRHAFFVFGPTYRAWLANGGPSGSLQKNAPGYAAGYAQGYPTSDTMNDVNGQVTYFLNVKVFSTPTGVRTVNLHEANISYQSGYLTTDQPVGGTAKLNVNSDGSWAMSYNFNNSSWFGTKYDYTVTITMISPTGNVFTFAHSYKIGAGGDSSTITGKNPDIAKYWDDLQGCQITAQATAGGFTFTNFFAGLGIVFGTPVPASESVPGGTLYFVNTTGGDPNYSEPDAPSNYDPADPTGEEDPGDPNS